MSMMGEMKFFFRLQVHQSPYGIFISQSQYTLELLKKHGMDGCDTINTPMATAKLDADLQGTPTDQTKYHSMIGRLMYLTASRSDIAFATFVAASGLRPYHFTYPERRLTMEEMLYKFIDKEKREHEKIRAFICEFRTTNEILFKERNNSLSELRFEVQELLKVIEYTPMTNCEIKGITTRCGKTTTHDVQTHSTNVHAKEPLVVNHDKAIESNKVLDKDQPQTSNEPVVQRFSKVQTPSIPFPRRLRKEKEEAQQRKFLENLKQLHINFPFIEALAQMPEYIKFLKGLLTNKARLEEACTITMNERCSAILLNKFPSKEKDPGSFTIPYDIGQLHINNALADLGVSISLMPYMMYDKLDDECYGIDDLDNTINAEAQELLANDKPDSFLLKGLEKSINQSDLESCGVLKETTRPGKVESEHLYSASANEIDDKKPELKSLPHHLQYAYLHGDKSFPIIILSILSEKEKMLLLQVLEKRKGAIAWKMSDIKGISPSYCHKILIEDDFKPVIQPRRRLNHKVQDVVKNEIVKLLDSGLIYPISNSSWVSPIYVVPKKGGMTVVLNDTNELIPSRTVTGWRVCIDYRKLNDAPRKDHFPLPFIDQMLERLCGNEYYCFLDGFSGFFQIPITPEDQENTTFTCLYGTFAYRRMLFGLCNAPATFQRCMTVIFYDMVKDFMEVFVDDFSVFSNSFNCCLANLDRMLARCEETNLVLNWEKCHFMVKEGIILGHKILGQNAPFELMCDASDFAVGVVLGQRIDRKFKPICYASKTLNNAQEHYTTTEKELLAVVFSFDKFHPYLILSKTIVYTDHSALKYLFSKQDAKPRLIRLENPDLGTFTEEEITNEFPNEHLMILKAELDDDEPWYADYVNYIVGKIVLPKWTPEKRRRFFSQVKNYLWDEPYAFRLCSDNVMRRCVAGSEILEILAHYHFGPTEGHHTASITGRKVYESGFF
ncbi:reverse transcriptase domain-containing protein [Tanacetum coccineum]